MVESASPDESTQTLAAFLSRRARASSDRRLALDAAAGIVVAAVAMIFRPPAWVPLLCAALCFASFGAWGITDRELAARGGSRVAPLRVVRVLASVIGGGAALGLVLTLFGYALGTWIS